MSTLELLNSLNTKYLQLHITYENSFWKSYMGDHTEDKAYQKSQELLDEFKGNILHYDTVCDALNKEKDIKLIERLKQRKYFFEIYTVPAALKPLKDEIIAYENDLQSRMANQKTGYIDPSTGDFVSASTPKMRMLMTTEDNESLRKACYEGIEKAAPTFVEDLVWLVKKRNEYARAAGYKNFYEFKAVTEERMKSTEIYDLFNTLTEKLQGTFAKIRALEKETPGLRDARNFGYMMAGDFVKEEDQYYPLEKMIDIWGKSFSALGIDYQGAKMRLDLLERKGKYNNGFCHQPVPCSYIDGIKQTGETNFTCNAIPGQIGSGERAGVTLFHEGGHAAHFSNMIQEDVILNTEYAPMSVSWAETQSMFLDTMYSSIEWKMRYAKNIDGNAYPRTLYEKQVKKMRPLAGRGMLGIASVVKFEEILYQTPDKQLTYDFVIKTAKELSKKYMDYTQESLRLLTIPHIYSWNSSAYYHGYGMATLALTQIRQFFYSKDGYIVDNPAIGPFLSRGWNFGSAKSGNEIMEILIGESLDPTAYLEETMKTVDEKLATAKKRITKMQEVNEYSGPVNLNATIEIRDGKELIGSTEDGWETMNEKRKEKVRDTKSI